MSQLPTLDSLTRVTRPSYGPEAKKRSKQLLVALLDYANDELDCRESVIDVLRPHIQIHWQTDQRFVVRTKVRFLESLSKLVAAPLTGEHIKEALRRFEDFLEILEDNRPNRGGSETWHFTLNLWHLRSERTENLRRFDSEWDQRRPQKSKQVTGQIEADSEPQDDVWWQFCRESLEAQQYQRLTTNPLTVTNGLRFDLHELYVPLGLIERKQQDRQEADISSDKGSQMYEPEESETIQGLSLQDFLARLQSQAQQRIALVGEPGAGKTTLLQKIATWLLDHQAMPIWISLADLQGATLEHYLLQDWLKQATRKVSVTPELQEALAEQFHQGRVWLLLDGVDEMALNASTALVMIARQLRGWLADAHVVLTCRLNVWDGSKNALGSFITYRNLSFSYGGSATGDQVRQFIARWFQDNPELSNRLRVELDKPERKRLKDAVKNPLRLALLCRSWSLTQGTLPSTKATLYQQFVETIYEWKQDHFQTTPAQRQQLNQALGQLALQALAQPHTRFRLPHSFVQQAFSSIELMPLALQLGWLNQVGISATSGEKVYAFYHPTFQEYFAAQAIADWQFFFNLTPDLPVFSPHWREVILLWLGRTDVSIADKEAFIQTLMEFEDRCGGFYHYQAYFLAAVGLAEFPQCSRSETILAQLMEWRFGAAATQQPRRVYSVPLCEGARVALLKTDRTLAISALEKFIQSSVNPFGCWNAAYTLGKTFAPGHPVAIAAFTQLLDTIDNETLRLQISDSLGKVDSGNARAVRTLIEILDSTQLDTMRRKAAYCLGKIAPGNLKAITTLGNLIATTPDSALRLLAAENLITLAPENALAIKILETDRKGALKTSQKRRSKSARLQEIDKVIAMLEQRLLATEDAVTQRRIAYRLGTLQPGHPQAINALLQLLLSQQSSTFYKRVVENLKEVLSDEQLAEIVFRLKQGLPANQGISADASTEKLLPQAHECYKLLWYCSKRMTYDGFYKAWSS